MDKFDKLQAAGLEEEVKGLMDLLSVAQVVVSSLELDEVLQDIIGSAMAIMDMPAGSIALYDEAHERFSLHAHAGFSPSFVACTNWSAKEGSITEHALQESDSLVIEDIRRMSTSPDPPILDEKIRAVIATPLRIQKQVVGMIYLDDFRPRTFPPQRLRLLSILASFAAMSIDNARLHERTRRLACTDGLTGLFNYRHFKQTFREELARNQRYGNSMSLIMFDIDNFKAFNDRFGHPFGDRALITIAGLMRESLREADHLFRYGGEEFMAILPETDIAEALVAAERTRLNVEVNFPGFLEETEAAGHGLTISAGVVTHPRDGNDLDALLKAVDDLLYKAKKCGKNKVYHLPGEIAKTSGKGGTVLKVVSARP